MHEAHKVLATREGIRTPVTHGKGVRHPYIPNDVGLSMLNPLVCDNASMRVLKDGNQKTNARCYTSLSNHAMGGTRSWKFKA